MIHATLAEVLYIPTTWKNTSNPTRRLLFHLFTLAHTAGPTFYINIVENQPGGGRSLFFIVVLPNFSFLMASRMFGDRVTSTSCKYLVSAQLSDPTFTSVPNVFFIASCIRQQVHGVVLCPNPCFLRSNPGQSRIKMQNCHGKLFSDSLIFKPASTTVCEQHRPLLPTLGKEADVNSSSPLTTWHNSPALPPGELSGSVMLMMSMSAVR